MIAPRTSARLLAALAAGLLLALALPGCGGRTKMVSIDTSPAERSRGASIYIDGKRQGVTRNDKVRLEYGPDSNQRILIQVVKDGFVPEWEYWKLDEVPEEKVFNLEEE
jgi:hypothetical protein